PDGQPAGYWRDTETGRSGAGAGQPRAGGDGGTGDDLRRAVAAGTGAGWHASASSGAGGLPYAGSRQAPAEGYAVERVRPAGAGGRPGGRHWRRGGAGSAAIESLRLPVGARLAPVADAAGLRCAFAFTLRRLAWYAAVKRQNTVPPVCQLVHGRDGCVPV